MNAGVLQGIFKHVFIVVAPIYKYGYSAVFFDSLFLWGSRNALAFVGVCFCLGAIFLVYLFPKIMLKHKFNE